MAIQLNNLKSAVSTTQFNIQVCSISVKGIIKFIYSRLFPLYRFSQVRDSFWTDLSNQFYDLVYCRLYLTVDPKRCMTYVNRICTVGYPSIFKQVIGYLPIGGRIVIAFRNELVFTLSEERIKAVQARLDDHKYGDKLLEIAGLFDTNRVTLTNEDPIGESPRAIVNVFLTNETRTESQIQTFDTETKTYVFTTAEDITYDILLPSTSSNKLSIGFIFFAFLTPYIQKEQIVQVQLLLNLLGVSSNTSLSEIYTLQNEVAKETFSDKLVKYDVSRSTEPSALTKATQQQMIDEGHLNRLKEGTEIVVNQNPSDANVEDQTSNVEPQVTRSQPAPKPRKGNNRGNNRSVASNAFGSQSIDSLINRGFSITLFKAREQ